jgi:hypothetical protein
MKALMDEVRFEEGGVVVQNEKEGWRSSKAAKSHLINPDTRLDLGNRIV